MVVLVETFVNGCVVVFGLIWGSYLNVVVYRLPRGLSTAVPPSHCPRCASRISPVENVPVLSWLFLGARCRHCRGSISARYPLVEASVAGIFLLGFHRFGEPLGILVSWILGCILLALALIDFDRRLVPVVLTLPVGLIGWALQPVLGWARPVDAVATSIFVAAFLLAASHLWARISAAGGHGPRDEALGLGDAYAVFLVGAFFGFEGTLRVLVPALAAATAVLVLSKLWQILGRRLGLRPEAVDRLPLVTFLGLAALWHLLLDPGGPGLDPGGDSGLAGIMGGP